MFFRYLYTFFTDYLSSFLVYGSCSFIIGLLICRHYRKKTLNGNTRNSDPKPESGNEKFSTVQNIGILLLSVYLACLLSVTVLPQFDIYYNVPTESWKIDIYRLVGRNMKAAVFNANAIPFHTIISYFTGGEDAASINFIGNIGMYMPYSFLLGIIFGRQKKKVLGIPVLSSCVIEFLQFFETGRNSDVDDVILNSIGAVFGYLLFLVVGRKTDKKMSAEM